MKNKIKICLLWHNLKSSNFGVGALSYQQINDLSSIFKEKNREVEFFSYGTRENSGVDYGKYVSDFKIVHKYLSLSMLIKCFFSKKYFDLIVDIGEGDSFSDIYGIKRFLYLIISKSLFNAKVKMLAPQKYGPFHSNISLHVAAASINSNDYVFTRDTISHSLLNDHNIKSILAPDVAFRLPFTKKPKIRNSIGINVSGLLWNSESLSNNISIRNYRNIFLKLINLLLNDGKKIYLISHVISDKNRKSIDDDQSVNQIIKNDYYRNNSNVILSNTYNPIDTKTLISSLDFVIVSRMHAAIAAFSTSTPFIALGYSSKYKGTFDLLDYKYIFNIKENHMSSKKIYSLYKNDLKEIKHNLKKSKKILIKLQNKYEEVLRNLPI